MTAGSWTPPPSPQGMSPSGKVGVGCLLIVGVFLLIIVAAAIGGRAGGGSKPPPRAAQLGGGYATKATYNERIAAQRVGGLDAENVRLYHLGLQHIRNAHQKPSSFTIGQVIDQERGREQQRRDIAAAQALAREHVRERAAAAAQAAREARIAAEEAHLEHGTPECLVLDDRTLTSESGEYTWYIIGKVQNRCDRGMSYVQVTFNFYDNGGNLTNSGLVNVNNLGAGETWSFKKSVYESDATGGKWRIAKISGF